MRCRALARRPIVPALALLATCVWLGGPAVTNAWAQGRSPVLERFIARFNPQSTTTFYIAVASDPDGGKVTYAWSLKAECGVLTQPRATGSTNGYAFGSAVRKPDGCSTDQEQRARIMLRIVDREGCAVVYTQAARNETEHIRPTVQTLPCPPGKAGSAASSADQAGSSNNALLALGVVILVASLIGGYAVLQRALAEVRQHRQAKEPVGNEEPAVVTMEPSRPPGWRDSSAALPTRRYAEKSVTEAPPLLVELSSIDDVAVPAAASVDDVRLFDEAARVTRIDAAQAVESFDAEALFGSTDDLEDILRDDDDLPSLLYGGIDDQGVTVTRSPPTQPVEASSVERDVAAVVAESASLAPDTAEPRCREGEVRRGGNDFVAHDTVLGGAVRAGIFNGSRQVEITTGDARDLLRLADALASDAALEVEVEIPLRLVTVVSTRQEVCKQGRWVLEVQSVTHDGPERVERLRAIVTSPEDLERFADQIVSRRLRTLGDARRRLEAALHSMRGTDTH